MKEEKNYWVRGVWGKRGEGRKPISIELCYAPGPKQGTLHTLSHLTLRTTLEVGRFCHSHIAYKKINVHRDGVITKVHSINKCQS